MFNWQKPTELASRIQSLMPPDTTGSFSAFGWDAVNVVVQGLVNLEDRPNLEKLAHYIEGGIEQVLEKSLEHHFEAAAPSDWRELVKPHLKRRGGGQDSPSVRHRDRRAARLRELLRATDRQARTQQGHRLAASRLPPPARALPEDHRQPAADPFDAHCGRSRTLALARSLRCR